MHRYNLSGAMHVRLMGDQFMDYRRGSQLITSSTTAALQRRGLLDERYQRTPEAMAYIQEKCDGRDERLMQRLPGVDFIRSDAGLIAHWNGNPDISIYVYAGSQPLLVLNGNGSDPLAVLSTRYMWDIQVGMTNGVKNAGHFLIYESVSGSKGSYGYGFDDVKAGEVLKHLHVE